MLECRTLPLLFLLQRRILFFFLDNDLFPPPLCMFLGASPSASLLARQVWLLGSSFCRFASLVFILRRYRAIFILQHSSSFLLLLHHRHHHHFLFLLLLRFSSPVFEDYLRARYYYTELKSKEPRAGWSEVPFLDREVQRT